jgi:hypothetical protein
VKYHIENIIVPESDGTAQPYDKNTDLGSRRIIHVLDVVNTTVAGVSLRVLTEEDN